MDIIPWPFQELILECFSSIAWLRSREVCSWMSTWFFSHVSWRHIVPRSNIGCIFQKRDYWLYPLIIINRDLDTHYVCIYINHYKHSQHDMDDCNSFTMSWAWHIWILGLSKKQCGSSSCFFDIANLPDLHELLRHIFIYCKKTIYKCRNKSTM